MHVKKKPEQNIWLPYYKSFLLFLYSQTPTKRWWITFLFEVFWGRSPSVQYLDMLFLVTGKNVNCFCVVVLSLIYSDQSNITKKNSLWNVFYPYPDSRISLIITSLALLLFEVVASLSLSARVRPRRFPFSCLLERFFPVFGISKAVSLDGMLLKSRKRKIERKLFSPY